MDQNTFYITIDLKAVMRFKRMTPQRRSKVFDRAGQRYRKFLRNRFISLSAGGNKSTWPELAESTLKRKEARGEATNINWILRESDYLLNNLEAKTNPSGFDVGYLTDGLSHPNYDGTVGQLAIVHQYGVAENNLPARPIIVRPTPTLYRMLARDIQAGIGDVIIEVNR